MNGAVQDATKTLLICVASARKFEAGQHKNLQIERQAPIVDVPEIAIDSTLHLLDACGLASVATDLGPSGNYRLDVMTERIVRQQVAIMIVVGNCVRSRPDQRHVSIENVKELGDFIDARS